MRRRSLIKGMGLTASTLFLSRYVKALESPDHYGASVHPGTFLPNWESLQKNYHTPDWFSKAKFGIWAHWGPQCQPGSGDWYARRMYEEGSKTYQFHLKKYGHPSVFGFKDVIHEWKAEKWDPQSLVALYKNAGAQYFVALANHHDNLDLYRSKYQPNWNSTRVGPKKDVIGGWSKAAKEQGLPFGVSVHASHAWTFYEVAQRSDQTGSLAGVPYDGKLQKKDGAGKWWNGLDPQELYEQKHPLSENSGVNGILENKQWRWQNGAAKPTQRYINNFIDRTIDLIDSYNPDLVYFDDAVLPFWPLSDECLKITAHLYNKSIKDYGSLKAVMNAKGLDLNQRKAMVWDIERGKTNAIEPLPWQTDTCIGSWHYDQSIYERKAYKPAKTIIQMLVDIVSKNGNLLLNIPVRGDGTIDDQEQQIVQEIGRWMKVNGESIYDTVPWKIFGEGPAQETEAQLVREGFNEGKGRAFGPADIRFTCKPNILFATVFGWPETDSIVIKSLANGSANLQGPIQRVELLSTKQVLEFERRPEGLRITLPKDKPLDSYASVFKILTSA
ncbi:alpha-L-fucosidase [Mucilaginibacter terrae]|uniref:alpha-L-fucosidase n=1 Tax=Mucilaginibacter terrae TaxID=1955052 RepID=UPI0036351762